MKIRPVIELLRYYGVRGFVAKAWEKIVIDPKRFRGNRLGDPPVFLSENKTDDAAQSSEPETRIRLAPPRTILYLVHHFFPETRGGTERFVFNQAKEQLKKGNNAQILTLVIKNADKCVPVTRGMKAYSYNYQDIPVTAFCYEKTPIGLYYKRIEENDVCMEAFARHQLELIKPDIVHCAYAQPMAAFLKVCRQMKIPYLITLTGFDSVCHYTTMLDKHGALCKGSEKGRRCAIACRTYGIRDYEKRYQTAESYLKAAAAVTAPSKYVADVMRAEFTGLCVKTIPHGIRRRYSPVKRDGPVRKFAFLGTLTELKGIHLLIKAFQNISDPECTLTISGQGSAFYEKQLQKLTANDCRVRFNGPLDPEAVDELYAQSDCVVVPSLVPETYNFVIREAASSGCLVIGSNLGALPEAILPGKNGFLFTPGDISDLTRALQQAMAFDWKQYVQMEFSLPKDEAEQYGYLYECL